MKLKIKVISITAAICIFVTCLCSMLINTHEVGDPFMKGSGDIIQGIKKQQHETMDVFDVEYEEFDGEW